MALVIVLHLPADQQSNADRILQRSTRLPDCPDSALRNNEDAVDLTDMSLTGRRILIVDDNRDAADSLRELLAARGADTMAVYDGPSAL